MKKCILLILSLLMVFVMTACGGSSDAADAESSASNESAEASASEEEQPAGFEEQVLFDNDQCTMIVKDFDENGDWGPTFKVYLENKTSDQTLMFAVEDASVNGYMLDPLFATEVAAGKKENAEISWFTEELEENDIEKIEEVDLQMRVYNSDDWEADPYVEETFTLTIPQ